MYIVVLSWEGPNGVVALTVYGWCFQILTVDSRLVPSRYLSVFRGERRLGIRLRCTRGLMGREKGKIAIFPFSLPMRPRACLNLIPNLLSPRKTLITTGYESGLTVKFLSSWQLMVNIDLHFWRLTVKTNLFWRLMVKFYSRPFEEGLNGVVALTVDGYFFPILTVKF